MLFSIRAPAYANLIHAVKKVGPFVLTYCAAGYKMAIRIICLRGDESVLEIRQDNGVQLYADGWLLLAHSAAAPFAVAVRREKTYSSSRGTVKTRVVEAERIPLTECVVTDGGLSFSAGGHSLRMDYSDLPGGADIRLSGEAGFGYELHLPAIDRKSVV